jgi:hypothetical protein
MGQNPRLDDGIGVLRSPATGTNQAQAQAYGRCGELKFFE